MNLRLKEGTIFICLEPYITPNTGNLIKYGELVEYNHFDEDGYWFVSSDNVLFNFTTEEILKNHLEYY